MKFDHLAFQRSMRHAFETLKTGVEGKQGQTVRVPEQKITMPAKLIQEQAYVSTVNLYTFEFGTNAPVGTSVLNNVLLGENNVFVAFGLQVMLGEGANANNRQYRTRGLTTSDNALYNAQLSMKFESEEPMQKMDTIHFLEEGDFNTFAGIVPIEPLRVFSGRVARSQVIITFPNSISGLTLTGNLFISVRLVGALGLA